MVESAIFNVNIYNPADGSSKFTNCIIVEEKIEKSDKLSVIRNHIVKDKKFDSDKARLAFCTKSGARMVDGTKFGVYLRQVQGPAAKSDGEEPKKETKDDTDADLATYDIYLEATEAPKEKKKNELSEQAKALLESKLDMDLVAKKPELLTATLKELSSNYKHENYQAEAGGDVVTGATMSERDWAIVLRNTHFLNGQRVVFTKNANGSRSFSRIDRALPFKLKPRQMDPLDVADGSIKVQEEYRIPHYVTTDDSYVNVYETASALSNSMAASSFSQMDIKASAGGSLFGASLSVKAGFSKNESKALASSSSSSTRSMNITYNFPRVVLHLDHRGLELTDHCKEVLEGVKDEESLIRFHHDYGPNTGHFFSANVQLGGRIFASEQFSSTESSSSAQTANAMKVAASASFSAGSFSASASYSRETQGAESRTNQNHSPSSPPKWCPTVKPFKNWRVINYTFNLQKDVMPIGDFLGSFPQYAHIPQKFEAIMEASKRLVACKFRLRALNQPGAVNEYSGLRKDKERKRHKDVLDKYEEELQSKAGTDVFQSARVNGHMNSLRQRVREDSFTYNYEEFVGIHSLDEGCNFEVEVETVLDRKPQLHLNHPYFIYNKLHNAYLAADTHGSYKDWYFGYLFYCRRPRASKWVFREKGNRSKEGPIAEGTQVELSLLDDNNQPVAFVQRFLHDKSTLMVSKYGVDDEKDLTTSHNSTVEYL
ncbi:hypothetical protein H072_6225 [Dactylellina haptotyla CBS 200.50]|uniref:MACPF domain-containing protein n=1 Tax=Dactylellina haptotyla (strain CBS 200.50) TaxID=1284197 RepID=S8AFM8_DACHA|nr:hypothetical protein H072_6225 [Dactylellina haptotyla CBS 200.50]